MAVKVEHDRTPPTSLYRYRPLGDDGLSEREALALEGSYLYAPRFEQMNDPMEALFEIAEDGDPLTLLLPHGFRSKAAEMLGSTAMAVKKFGLISMSVTHLDYPLWAYYGANFGGMCLEFDCAELALGVLGREPLLPVAYKSKPPAPVGLPMLALADPERVVMERLTQKRREWCHEKEWRYLTGQDGPKPHTDSALKRIYLGPRIRPEDKVRVVAAMERRPVEILQSTVRGYDLQFQVIKEATPWSRCERVGAGSFDPELLNLAKDALQPALGTHFEALARACERLRTHPNAESIDDVYLASTGRAVRVTVRYRFRSGVDSYVNHYFDLSMNPISREDARAAPGV